jgi:hypothetical protein
MAERHADELSLLAYVDGDLAGTERDALEEHLQGCSTCAAEARRLGVGRDALRAAPLLELSEERRRTMQASLSARKQRSAFLAPLRRLGPALPAAAALLLVATFVALATQLPRGGDGDMGGDAAQGVAEEESAGGGATEEDAGDAGGGTTPNEPAYESPRALANAELVARVEGPAGEVVRLLRRSGHPAFVRDGSVLVVGEGREIRAELASRPRGPVQVYVE